MATSAHMMSQVLACCKSAILKGAASNSALELAKVSSVVLTFVNEHKFCVIQDVELT